MDLHTKSKMMVREARKLMNDQGKTAMQCRFCAEIVPLDSDEVPSFVQEELLIQHVKRSNEKHIANAKWTTPELASLHEELKGAYGVYDVDFWSNSGFRQQENQHRESRRREVRAASDPAIAFSEGKALVAPIPLPGHPGIMMGSFTSYAGNSIARGDIVAGPVPTMSKLRGMGAPPRGIIVGPMPSADRLVKGGGIDPEDADVIKAVPIPRTEGGFIGQGKRMKDQADKMYREQEEQGRRN
ncbi:hypothetical protein N0V93_000374 [Gnomoniopsis smithogilvyi]|uniref:Uncharacterized protein n=1 Tax=Gnomoniopsis smithogilvyi TaxID=1191159 RepID=A0A9W9D1N2_9PEZI|nr:hypothetical protein N0V93_000374 [Gnomoniopsis smithogilvyi]